MIAHSILRGVEIEIVVYELEITNNNASITNRLK